MALGQDEVGRRIQNARERAGLTQQQLAERIGLKHGQQISKYERGLVEIPIKKLARIAATTETRIEALLGEEPEPNPVDGEIRSELQAIRLLLEQLVQATGGEGPPRDDGEPL